MVFRRSLLVGSALVLISAVLTPGAFAHDRRGFGGLQPGEFVAHELKVPIRVVLIGFDRDQVNTDDIQAWLPATYDPVVRYPRFYGMNGRDLGLKYTFDYKIVWKGRHFARRFFHYLKATGVESPRTFYQNEYNLQDLNVLEVPETVLFIDAPSVEKWLDRNDRHRPHCGPSGKDGYTIYFINWYGREDFQFHVYTKTDEPDPDTHLNFGEAYSSRKVRAWGGTSSRGWFFDFSAGPEWNDGSYVVDDRGAATPYRIPVIWEYAALGFRDPAQLGYDMGLLSRFVAINLLFTSSPLYDPLVTAPDAWGRKVAHITMFEDDPDPAENGIDFIDASFAKKRLRSFEPYYHWKVGLEDVDPIDDGAKEALDTFTQINVQDGCWQTFGDPFASLYCYFDANRDAYVPPYGKRDYVAPVYSFNTIDGGLGVQDGLLGFADDNWVDGTQSYVFTFGTPFYRELGYGFTATTVHELGHHIGLSHPHDGYDPEYGDYGTSDLYFAWTGDESDTVMHYITLSNGFGAHNRDNMYRWEAAGYLNRANILAGDILASPKSWKAKWLLRQADYHAAVASHALSSWKYLKAVTHARWAWTILSKGADEMGISSARLAAAQLALPNPTAPRGCYPRLPEH